MENGRVGRRGQRRKESAKREGVVQFRAAGLIRCGGGRLGISEARRGEAV